MKIGILGGTFNPIHLGHTELAMAAFRECGLDRVLIMPSGVSYLKAGQNITSGESRLEMCRIACRDIPFFEVSDIEVKRQGNTYTYETLEQLKEMYPGDRLYFILGADSLFYMDKWVKPEKIFSLCTVVCSGRGKDDDFDALKQAADSLKSRFNADVVLLGSQIRDVSSTQVREMLEMGASRENMKELLDTGVYDYITEYGLFGSN